VVVMVSSRLRPNAAVINKEVSIISRCEAIVASSAVLSGLDSEYGQRPRK
jgi:hypothetical protein